MPRRFEKFSQALRQSIFFLALLLLLLSFWSDYLGKKTPGYVSGSLCPPVA